MILITGGTGRLGTELKKIIPDSITPSKETLDIAKLHSAILNVDLIVHCAAYTNVAMAETEKELCYKTNVVGTRNLASLGIPMLYISTEYVFDGEKGQYAESDYPNPRNFYALTKLLGEYESRRTRSVVVRCLFKPRPFEHQAACVDQFTSGDYVDRMAMEIAKAIRIFDRLPPTIHIGFERKSTYELARETRPDVIPITVESIGIVRLPRDTSLCTDLWQSISHDVSLEKKSETQ